MRNFIYLCLFFICSGVVVSGCSSFRGPEQTEPSYRWSSFFNNDCSPMPQFALKSEDEAILSYACANSSSVSQFARRHQLQGEVELWTASDLPRDQLNYLSRSKCRASLIYLGPAHATIKFPCALIHMTVNYDIISRLKDNDTFLLQLKPKKVLITYGDGVQEFHVEEDRLTPLGPFKPFLPASPLFTNTLEDNKKRAFDCL